MQLRKIAALIVACFILAGCNPDQMTPTETEGGEQVVCPKDQLFPISEEILRDADKVNVNLTFDIPDTLRENAQVFDLPLLVSDGMMLQALAVNRIWGSCTENGPIAVRLTDLQSGAVQTYFGECKEGSFAVYVGSNPHGTRHRLEIITPSGNKNTINDVVFGELFLACGQSNMGWTVGQCYLETTLTLLYQEEINDSYNEQIRLFGVTPVQSQTKVSQISNSSTNGWQIAQPSVVLNFSATAYFLARELNRMYQIPVGVICSCMGGTDIYTWIPQKEAADCQGTVVDASTHYNAMIHPLQNVNARAVLWYQGEGSEAQHYPHNFRLLAEGWRRTFQRDDLFFAIVQLPRYAADDQGTFERREAQKLAATTVADCAYSVNIDLGLMEKDIAQGDELNPRGIHPYDKRPLANRLAHMLAEELYYAKGVWSGPVLEDIQVDGNRAILTYSNVGEGLILRGKAGFEIFAASGKTVACEPKLISKTKVELTVDSGEDIKMIRYGYSSSSVLIESYESYADCVCLYNTKNGGKAAYPAEQFLWMP